MVFSAETTTEKWKIFIEVSLNQCATRYNGDIPRLCWFSSKQCSFAFTSHSSQEDCYVGHPTSNTRYADLIYCDLRLNLKGLGFLTISDNKARKVFVGDSGLPRFEGFSILDGCSQLMVNGLWLNLAKTKFLTYWELNIGLHAMIRFQVTTSVIDIGLHSSSRIASIDSRERKVR